MSLLFGPNFHFSVVKLGISVVKFTFWGAVGVFFRASEARTEISVFPWWFFQRSEMIFCCIPQKLSLEFWNDFFLLSYPLSTSVYWTFVSPQTSSQFPDSGISPWYLHFIQSRYTEQLAHLFPSQLGMSQKAPVQSSGSSQVHFPHSHEPRSEQITPSDRHDSFDVVHWHKFPSQPSLQSQWLLPLSCLKSNIIKEKILKKNLATIFQNFPEPSVALHTKVPWPEQNPRFVPSAPVLKTSRVEHWHHFPEIWPSASKLQTQWSFGHVPLPEQISVGIKGLIQSLQLDPGVGQSGRLNSQVSPK